MPGGGPGRACEIHNPALEDIEGDPDGVITVRITRETESYDEEERRNIVVKLGDDVLRPYQLVFCVVSPSEAEVHSVKALDVLTSKQMIFDV